MDNKRRCPFNELNKYLKELSRLLYVYASKFYGRYENYHYKKKINYYEYLSIKMLDFCDDIKDLKCECNNDKNLIIMNGYLSELRMFVLNINDTFSKKLKRYRYVSKINKKEEKNRRLYFSIVSIIVDIINKINTCRGKIMSKSGLYKNVFTKLHVGNYINEIVSPLQKRK